ncbi:MAG TPA: hypothetical protein VIQ31_24405 [Phormidium sp.]
MYLALPSPRYDYHSHQQRRRDIYSQQACQQADIFVSINGGETLMYQAFSLLVTPSGTHLLHDIRRILS